MIARGVPKSLIPKTLVDRIQYSNFFCYNALESYELPILKKVKLNLVRDMLLVLNVSIILLA